jgi:hypothetical protein
LRLIGAGNEVTAGGGYGARYKGTEGPRDARRNIDGHASVGRTGMHVSVLGFACGAAVGGLKVRGDPADQERTIASTIAAGAGGALCGSTERHPIASPPEPIGSAMRDGADLARAQGRYPW